MMRLSEQSLVRLGVPLRLLPAVLRAEKASDLVALREDLGDAYEPVAAAWRGEVVEPDLDAARLAELRALALWEAGHAADILDPDRVRGRGPSAHVRGPVVNGRPLVFRPSRVDFGAAGRILQRLARTPRTDPTAWYCGVVLPAPPAHAAGDLYRLGDLCTLTRTPEQARAAIAAGLKGEDGALADPAATGVLLRLVPAFGAPLGADQLLTSGWATVRAVQRCTKSASGPGYVELVLDGHRPEVDFHAEPDDDQGWDRNQDEE